MCWEKMSYWLKGGIIGLIIGIIYNILELIIYKTDLNQWLIYLVADLIFVFIVGAILGFVISKIIKNKSSGKLPRKRKRR